MKKYLLSFIIFLFCTVSSSLFALQIEFHSFQSPERERLYLALIAELRCVKCQNQNLAESDAELAKDMREKTYQMITEGKSRDDVVNYMTARYGDFVLYKPPFKMKTLLLWAGPPLLLFFSLFFVVRMIRNQPKQTTDKLADSDLESVRNVLQSNNSREK